MKSVQLLAGILIETVNHPAGAIVAVTDEKARELVRHGVARDHDGPESDVANPDHNPYADAVTPLAPGGPAFNPVDALAPNVEDNPGLKKLAEVAKARAKSAKARPEDQAGKVDATTTANELSPGAKPAEPKPAPSEPKPAEPKPAPSEPKPAEVK